MCFRISSGPLASLPSHRSALLALAAACSVGLSARRAAGAGERGSSDTRAGADKNLSATLSAEAESLSLG